MSMEEITFGTCDIEDLNFESLVENALADFREREWDTEYTTLVLINKDTRTANMARNFESANLGEYVNQLSKFFTEVSYLVLYTESFTRGVNDEVEDEGKIVYIISEEDAAMYLLRRSEGEDGEWSKSGVDYIYNPDTKVGRQMIKIRKELNFK